MSTHATGADLGRAVRRLRKAHGLKIEALAFAADMHPTYLSGIERGLRNPTWRKLCGLADALDVSVSTLAGEAEEEAVVAHIERTTREHLRAQSNLLGMPPTQQQTPVSAWPGA
jgi:transcriptional regulator with XRE-family HTH domain